MVKLQSIRQKEKTILANNKEWNREIANQIWQKLKGKSVPDSYSDKECEEILKRYWHKAMESEQ